MWESQVIREWKAAGRVEGRLEEKRSDLLLVLRERFQTEIPGDLAQKIEQTTDLGVPTGWLGKEKVSGPFLGLKGVLTPFLYHMLVDLRRIYTLSVDLVREHAAGLGDRVRLLPPYREHLSQAFARFFMRVGLAVDVAPFR